MTQACHSVGLLHVFSGLRSMRECKLVVERHPVRSCKGDFWMELSGVRSHQPAASLFERVQSARSGGRGWNERCESTRDIGIGVVEWKGNERSGDGSKANAPPVVIGLCE